MAQTRLHSIISLAILALLALPPSATAGTYYASPTGDDANDCQTLSTPCQTAQAAVDKMPLGPSALFLAPGSYGEINVVHTHQISVNGMMANGACLNANVVTVSNLWAQDHAVLWANCLTTGQIACRQEAIVDVADVVFDGTKGLALAANETCRINTGRKLWLNGQVAAFAVATNYSTLFFASEIIISQPNLSLAYFVRAVDSTVDFSAATFSGYRLAAGYRFLLDKGTIIFPAAGAAAIPGQGSDAKNFSVCRPCD